MLTDAKTIPAEERPPVTTRMNDTMNAPLSSVLALPLVARAALPLTACDQGVGVHELILRTSPEGDPLDPLGSCMLVSDGGESVGGGGSGPGSNRKCRFDAASIR